MDALQKLTGKTKFEPKVMKYSHFYDSEGNMIDKGMAVFFKGKQKIVIVLFFRS